MGLLVIDDRAAAENIASANRARGPLGSSGVSGNP